MASSAKSPKKEIADIMLKVYRTKRQTFTDNRDNQHQIQRVSLKSLHLFMEFIKNKFLYRKCSSELRFFLIYYKLFVS